MLSFDADLSYVEKKMIKIEFSRTGDISHIKVFKKKMYDD